MDLFSNTEHARTEFIQQLPLQARITLISVVKESCFTILVKAKNKKIIKLNQNTWVDQKKKKKNTTFSYLFHTQSSFSFSLSSICLVLVLCETTHFASHWCQILQNISDRSLHFHFILSFYVWHVLLFKWMLLNSDFFNANVCCFPNELKTSTLFFFPKERRIKSNILNMEGGLGCYFSVNLS